MITDKDNGYNALVARLKTFGKAELTVGILPEQAAELHKVAVTEGHVTTNGVLHRLHRADNRNEKGQYKNLSTIGEVAAGLEFGTRNAPARPIVRGYWDENKSSISQAVAKYMPAVLAGKIPIGLALGNVGKKVAEGMKKRIFGRIPPPNAQKTVDRKGSDVPNLDTGQVAAALSWEVKK